MLTPTLEEFSKIIGHLYDGHIEEDPYNNFLTGMRAIIDSNFASITLREPVADDGGLLFVSCDQLPKTFIDDHDNPYTDRYYTSNLMTNLPWGEVVTLDECHSYSSLEDSELYEFCMKPINIHHMAGIDLRNANGQRFSVRFCRPKSAKNFGNAERAILALIAPHIQRAVANGMQLIQLDNERKLYSKTFTRQSIGIITLDERGKVITRNAIADELLRSKDGIHIINDTIHLDSATARAKFTGYVEEVLEAQRQQSVAQVNALSVDRPSGKADLEILIKPMMIDKSVDPSHTPHMMVFINEPEKSYDIDIRILMSIYGLTRAEALLAKYLAEGANLDQSAQQLGIARNTARAQLRSIFAKTGVSQQSMLVSLILKSLVTFS
ncbi:helix-turn-helix transcriptional regulator [Gammaproteobacteria bacterium LSUCC0057]|uniref:Helix-turn-helix transcriptional regulator n=1 Tax=Gammaproteobacteria bacterium LSUCC0057 TaxID=2559237 RepID=A0A4Y8UM62_9GAMM|nr:helix-turn-helix transcriptional regulator [Gammaproteobacteria bacterium LSUCC0057]